MALRHTLLTAAPYLPASPVQLCNSDTEPLSMADVLRLADADSLQRWQALSLAYTETQGLPALREAIAGQYAGVRPEEVVVAAPQELIYLALRALCQPGDHIVVTHPGYQSLYSVAESMGCEVSYWRPTCGPAGELSFNMGTLLAVMREETKMVVVNFPHNPTGTWWLAVVHGQCGVPQVPACTPRYRGLEFDASLRLPSAVESYPERGITLCGCSKSVGMPGIRIGWLVTHDCALVRRVLELKDYTSICNSAPSEVLGLITLRNWDALLAGQLEVCRTNVGFLHQFFGRCVAYAEALPFLSPTSFDLVCRHDFLRWQLPVAGTIAFPELQTGERIDAWSKQLVQEAGVLLMPSTVYGPGPWVEQSRFRVGFGRKNLPAVLDKLDSYLKRRYV